MRIFVIKTYFDLFNIVLESFPIFYTACVICIEAVVFNKMHWERVGGSRNAKNRLLHVWVVTGDSWLRQSAGNAKNRLLLVLGRDRGFLVATEFFFGFVSRQEFLCRDMVLRF